MKQCKVCKNTKALSAFYEHSLCKQGVRPECRKCTLKNQAPYQDINKNKKSAYCRQWNIDNKEHVKQSNQIKYQNDKDGFKSRAKIWKKENPQKVLEFGKKYRENNRIEERIRLRNIKLKRNKRIPSWLSQEDLIQIDAKYRLAKELTKITKINHHVDHIIPFNGKTVSGLHVPNNLRIVTAKDNLIKGNRFDG